MQPKVTIGVCVRNCESTIYEAVKSIVSQKYPHQLLEIIVVDGYSTDRTVEIIKEVLSKSDIKSCIFYENKGLGFAREIVVDNAKGEYIVWVDGDMILPADFVERQVDYMEKNPNVGVAKGRYGLLEEDSIVATLENIDFMLNFSFEKKKMPRVLGASGCIYRLKALKEIGGFDKRINGVGEDMDVEHRIKAAGWELRISDAYFYERRRKTWLALWNEYLWHGKGGFYISRKSVKVFRSFPFDAFINRFIQAKYAYQLTRAKKVFLLPMHYLFKRTAWIIGFFSEFVRYFYRKAKSK